MKHATKSGFSLTEMMIAVGIAAVVSVAVMAFYIQSAKSGYASEQQMKLLTTMRALTNELIYNGSRSHELVLYNSAATADITASGRKIVVNEGTSSTADDTCPTGDFVVFIYYELPKPAAQAKYRISKLIGYYLTTYDTGPAGLMRITVDLSASPSTDTVENILINNWNTAAKRMIATRVTPLALSDDAVTSTPPQLFYKRANQNIAVCGQLLQSATSINTKDWRSYTRSFYFSVTVRS